MGNFSKTTLNEKYTNSALPNYMISSLYYPGDIRKTLLSTGTLSCRRDVMTYFGFPDLDILA